MSAPQEGRVVDNPQEHRFELAVEGGTAVAYYKFDGDRIVLTHTEVPQELSGRGIGSRLARGVFDSIRQGGHKVVPRCPFMGAWAAKHRDYDDIVDG